MSLFKRKRSHNEGPPVDPDERSPQLGLRYGDLAVLASLIEHGADLTQPREVIFYLYFTNREGAELASEVARREAYNAEVREPLPDNPDQWSLVCQRDNIVTTPEYIRDADTFFDALAEAHGGDYDGWEASV